MSHMAKEEILAVCKCERAVKIIDPETRLQTWTMDQGAVSASKTLKGIIIEECCLCCGHSGMLGGFHEHTLFGM